MSTLDARPCHVLTQVVLGGLEGVLKGWYTAWLFPLEVISWLKAKQMHPVGLGDRPGGLAQDAKKRLIQACLDYENPPIDGPVLGAKCGEPVRGDSYNLRVLSSPSLRVRS